MSIENYTIDESLHGQRLDKALATLCPELSRTRLKGLIEEGMVSVNGQDILSPKHSVESDDEIVIALPPAEEADPEPEDIPLDIVFEDEDLIVINKAAGMVVHLGAGNSSGTLVNALLHYCPDDLSGIGGVKRPGIVHRLDKETSGLMVVAKNDVTHQALSAQLSDRSLTRVYHALVWRVPSLIKGKVDQPLGRHKTNRLKMAIRHAGGKEAITHYEVKENIADTMAWIECRLQTGRTHQIRVHMQHIKHPLVGDPLYGLPRQEGVSLLNRAGADQEIRDMIVDFPRQVLHAAEIGFIHPCTKERVILQSSLPDDLEEIKKQIKSIG